MNGMHPSSSSADRARERLSVLMDGEFPEDGRDAAFAAIIEQEAMVEDWAVYHCIGDVLRSSDMGCHSPGVARRVGERLRDEPHLVAAPARGGGVRNGVMRPLSALAAVAAVAAVGFVVWPQVGNQEAPVVAKAAPPVVVPAPSASVAPVSVEYLAAHRQFSTGPALRGSLVQQGQTVAFESAR